MIHRRCTTIRTAPRGVRGVPGFRGFRGFSLLELVIVVAIIGAVSGMAIPRYVGALNRYRADALARRIAADLEFIAADARAASQARTVWFVPDQWYLSFGAPDPNYTNNSYYLVQTTLEPYRAYIRKVSFEGYNQFTFDGYGKPDRGGSVVVGSGDATRTVVLDKTTGKASVQ